MGGLEYISGGLPAYKTVGANALAQIKFEANHRPKVPKVLDILRSDMTSYLFLSQCCVKAFSISSIYHEYEKKIKLTTIQIMSLVLLAAGHILSVNIITFIFNQLQHSSRWLAKPAHLGLVRRLRSRRFLPVRGPRDYLAHHQRGTGSLHIRLRHGGAGARHQRE